MDWTDAMDDELRELWSQGVAVGEIAQRLGLRRAGQVYYRRTALIDRRRWPRRLDQAREAHRLEREREARAIQDQDDDPTVALEEGDGTDPVAIEGAEEDRELPLATGAQPPAGYLEDESARLVRLYRDGVRMSAIAAALGLEDAPSVWARIRAMRADGTWERTWDVERGRAMRAGIVEAATAEPARHGPEKHATGDTQVEDLYWQARIGHVEAKRLFSLFSLHVPVRAEGRFDVWIRVARADETRDGAPPTSIAAFGLDGGESNG